MPAMNYFLIINRTMWYIKFIYHIQVHVHYVVLLIILNINFFSYFQGENCLNATIFILPQKSNVYKVQLQNLSSIVTKKNILWFCSLYVSSPQNENLNFTGPNKGLLVWGRRTGDHCEDCIR